MSPVFTTLLRLSVGGALGLTLLMGCGQADPSSGDTEGEQQTYEQVMADYQAEYQRLKADIPRGATWKPKTGFQPGEQFQGSLTGEDAAQYQWTCLWVTELIENGADETRRTAAVAELDKVPTFSGWALRDDSGRTFHEQQQRAARLGDVSEWRSYHTANCS